MSNPWTPLRKTASAWVRLPVVATPIQGVGTSLNLQKPSNSGFLNLIGWM